MNILGKEIGKNDKVFVIAEIGMNHNGIFDNAIKLIDQASEIGVDCVKFQMRDLNELYSKDALDVTKSDLSTQYTMGLLRKFELTFDEYKKLAEYSRSKGLIFMCTPWDKKSADAIEKIGVPAFKTASADLTNFDLLEYLVAKNLPLILSTGMSTKQEIDETVEFLTRLKADFALLHCNSTYPAPFKDINLRNLENLQKYNVPIGYSGHERGTAVSIASVAMGARIIERHFTLDRDMEGPDHTASLEYNEFKSLVDGIREVELSLGSNKDREITQGELINRENLSKSIFAKVDIKKDEVFTKDMFEIKSPGQGLSPQYLNKIIGYKAIRDIEEGKALFKSDLGGLIRAKKEYSFNRTWALPVRFHDLNSLLENTNPKSVEFHMSFKDIEEDLEKFLIKEYDCEYIVHAPELFEDDHLLDLCTPNEEYRALSIKNLQRVIDKTLKMKRYFPKTKIPQIVVHCGGFTKDEELDISERPLYYKNLKDSISKLNLSQVELLPENMAPFPWLFGGQRYQNIFIDADEIIDFCNETKLQICQDVSHSHLACNKFNWDHLEYTKKLAPYTAHYHISDGTGVDGEGIQVGEGNVDFENMYPIINEYSPDASFIPEVWQGHKNNGEGFWISLERMENHI
ncbi:acetylneuraminic acid synthetase [Arcobacter sp. CECT 8983]|uniref:N-acetylneuraminate synthase family protein n=1 Tax=Arcobacter sp. CECT 8983 TaxID=2044508 RepID=UPI00100AA22B|nr:N-acetylneuraminate synthase family protein [Arcobacter sp. CECT 8983]RXJ89458.1 acetylneuraminic acid synthetase [Arcobacter sp. CECT 8983]